MSQTRAMVLIGFVQDTILLQLLSLPVSKIKYRYWTWVFLLRAQTDGAVVGYFVL